MVIEGTQTREDLAEFLNLAKGRVFLKAYIEDEYVLVYFEEKDGQPEIILSIKVGG